ncbi:MAG: GldG family protein [Thiothrix sp.]|nr:GldG family protein [Thiothrix sp.]HPE60013.1 GldG family protein [Thiolinea sp.]
MNVSRYRARMLRTLALHALLVMLVIGAGWLGYHYRVQQDWTWGSRNSLTPASQQLLSELTDPLEFVAYLPENSPLREQMAKIISRYQRARPDIRLEMVDADLDPVRARQDGADANGQLAIHLGERTEVVSSVGESVIANAILRLSRGHERLVVVLTGHGERDVLAASSQGMSTLVQHLEHSGFTILPYSLVRTQSVPDNARFLMLASPQQTLLPGEQQVLEQYVLDGGNLLWLQDPGGLHGLGGLSDIFDVTLGDGTLVDANENLHNLLGIKHPAVIPVVEYGGSVLAANLGGTQTLFPFATSVTRRPESAQSAMTWQVDEFLTTLPNSWLESGPLGGDVTLDEADGDVAGPLTVGLALNRKLADPAAGDDGRNRAGAVAGGRQRIVVLGDSDFMLNGFIGQGANLGLATNIFNWLSDDDNLLKVPLIQAPDTRLEMDERILLGLAVFFLLGLPLGLLLAGFWLWWRRRRL